MKLTSGIDDSNPPTKKWLGVNEFRSSESDDKGVSGLELSIASISIISVLNSSNMKSAFLATRYK